MVDVRAKGSSFEIKVRDILRKHTGVKYERAPASGAMGAHLGMKGDLIVPASTGKLSMYAIECKSYKDDQLTSNCLYPAEQTFDSWWEQASRQAKQMNMKPCLIFKKNYGKILIAVDEEIVGVSSYFSLTRPKYKVYIYLLDDVLDKINWIRE